MGRELFERFPRWVEEADEVMGLSMRELCLSDPERRLASTRFAQPAIFLVNALHLAVWREEGSASLICQRLASSFWEMHLPTMWVSFRSCCQAPMNALFGGIAKPKPRRKSFIELHSSPTPRMLLRTQIESFAETTGSAMAKIAMN